jgi:hypothetical protein
MNLPNPVTVNLPKMGTKTFTSLPVTIVDSSANKKVFVQMRPFMKTLTLWEGESYDVAGDYTQAQVESRILELLQPDIVSSLLSLYDDRYTQQP